MMRLREKYPSIAAMLGLAAMMFSTVSCLSWSLNTLSILPDVSASSY
jgi:hypothetical protein